jgi:uncharacterized membrane protein YgdD (TMEM256/DUF423 family)
MTATNRFLLAAGATALLLATALGAYGTHGLRGSIPEASWAAYETAIAYQFYHGLGLLAVAVVLQRHPSSGWLAASGWLLCTGIVLFCGSIYAVAFGAPATISSLAPLGGIAFMLGWLALAMAAIRVP